MATRQKRHTTTQKTFKEPLKKPAPHHDSSSRFKKVRAIALKLKQRRNDFLSRRPHRSFFMTRRRDYKRSFVVPGYWNFTNQVRRLLLQRKGLFIKFIVVYSIFSAFIFGIMSNDTYKILNDTLQSLTGDVSKGQIGDFSINFATFFGILSGMLSGQLNESQQIYGGLLVLLAWLTIVWLLRQTLAGHKNVRLRDGLYSSGSPLLSTFSLFLVVLLQLVPLVIAVAAYFTANSFNVLVVPFFSIIFWVVMLLLSVMSLYWLSGSFVALIVVTLPGMYPLKALKIAGDLVSGRRLRMLYRLGWLGFSLFVLWLFVLLPIIMVSNLINIAWLPLVPLTVLLLGSFSLVWASSYMYLLYRKLVDDGASPA